MDVQIKILLGDITTSNTEAIVNAANTNLLAGSGVCGAIFKAAGYEELQAECNKLSPIKTGDAVVTNGYNLKAKYVIHTAGPIYRSQTDAIYLRNSYYNSLLAAESNYITSISFPSISTGIYGYPIADASVVAINAIFEYFKDYPESKIKEVRFYLFDDYTFSIYQSEYERKMKELLKNEQ